MVHGGIIRPQPCAFLLLYSRYANGYLSSHSPSFLFTILYHWKVLKCAQKQLWSHSVPIWRINKIGWRYPQHHMMPSKHMNSVEIEILRFCDTMGNSDRFRKARLEWRSRGK